MSKVFHLVLTRFVLCFQKSSPRFSEDGLSANLSLVALEHPSPISVLDALTYRETEPSPVKTQGNKRILSLVSSWSSTSENIGMDKNLQTTKSL